MAILRFVLFFLQTDTSGDGLLEKVSLALRCLKNYLPCGLGLEGQVFSLGLGRAIVSEVEEQVIVIKQVSDSSKVDKLFITVCNDVI